MIKQLKLTVVTLLIFLTVTARAGSPVLGSVATNTKTLGTGSSDTLTVSDFNLGGDSVGVMLQFNSDSISGYVQYRYSSPDGYYNVALESSSTLTTWSNNPENTAVFSEKLPVTAGTYQAELYIIYTNNNYVSKSVTSKIYKVTWR